MGDADVRALERRARDDPVSWLRWVHERGRVDGIAEALRAVPPGLDRAEAGLALGLRLVNRALVDLERARRQGAIAVYARRRACGWLGASALRFAGDAEGRFACGYVLLGLPWRDDREEARFWPRYGDHPGRVAVWRYRPAEPRATQDRRLRYRFEAWAGALATASQLRCSLVTADLDVMCHVDG